jgi:hypothetical protein
VPPPLRSVSASNFRYAAVGGEIVVCRDECAATSVPLHLPAANYGTHKVKKVRNWLARRPRYHVQYTPSPCFVSFREACVTPHSPSC